MASRAPADPRNVDAAAVILHFDDHVLALPAGPQDDRRRRWLARAARSAALSSPWSRLLRRTCSRGSEIASTIVLSASRRGALDHQARGLGEGGRHLRTRRGKR
jgi:hypothetical protein